MTFKTSSKRTAEIEEAAKSEQHLLSGITHPGLNGTFICRGKIEFLFLLLSLVTHSPYFTLYYPSLQIVSVDEADTQPIIPAMFNSACS